MTAGPPQLVIDASVALSWLLDDEIAPAADAALRALSGRTGLAPAVWSFETRNALLTAQRRGRLDLEDVRSKLSAAESLPIELDRDPNFDAAMQLAVRWRLSIYDASYLELALRRGALLATLDRSLAAAAAAENARFEA
ncbi:MAG: type II toxin-antitoxin system VapC family toxin [Pseudomonadota bacterium]